MGEKLRLGLISGLLLWALALPAAGETVLAEIQRTGILKVALREDAAPYGYTDEQENLQGYCLDFFWLLKQTLIAALDRDTILVNLHKSTADNRFTLVADNTVNLECGPNTIGSDIPDNIQFSDSFFISGTQFLTRESNLDYLNVAENLTDIRLGVLNNTTTEEFIKTRYPTSELVLFRGVNGRSRGVQALKQGRIDAMVSDGILLRAEAQQQDLSTTEYPLIPESPLTCDRYGMIITKDSQWQDLINSLIASPALEVISDNWFGTFVPYLQGLENDCAAKIKSNP